jgi:hypothetical protein
LTNTQSGNKFNKSDKRTNFTKRSGGMLNGIQRLFKSAPKAIETQETSSSDIIKEFTITKYGKSASPRLGRFNPLSNGDAFQPSDCKRLLASMRHAHPQWILPLALMMPRAAYA